MKKIIIVLLLTLGISISNSDIISANENSYSFIDQVFEDGSYIQIDIKNANYISRSTKVNSKTATYKGSDGVAYWSITVKGTFTYNGATSKCLSSDVNTNNYSRTWKLSDSSASKSGATATASVTAKQYGTSGAILRSIKKTVTLTCDKNGNLS